jgi:hypothetical protein
LCFAVALLGSLLRVVHVARRVWRCPVCGVRWAAGDSLASFQWNHCPSCGEPLRAFPRERERERIARMAFEMETLGGAALRRRFALRRRRAAWLAGALVLAGVAAWAWVHGRASRDWMEDALAAGLGGAVAAVFLWSMRCPRCRGGLVGQAGACMRCGFRLDPASSPATPGDPDSGR